MNPLVIEERAKTAIELGESHFREFKSALHGEPCNKQRRPMNDIATNIAQTLVAFANADGGELLVGVEDNGDITGLDNFSDSDLSKLEGAPTTRVHKDTPLPSVKTRRIKIEDKTILYFSVPKSTQYIHVTSDGRCMLRNDLKSDPVAAEAIQFSRNEEASREYDRKFIDGSSVDDLDLNLVRPVADQIIKGMSIEKCLQYLDLAEYGMSQLKLRRAAILLFAREHHKWHPRLQIRIMKVDGAEVLTGENYNIISDQIITGNILSQVDKSWEAMRPHLVQTKFDKSAKFEQKTIYPELACREAILNAIAHRDYSQEGKGIEVYIYSDRLEVKSPGSLLSSVSLDDIIKQKGAHQSRNTYIARVLRELGYMRELGEGMRRIFNLMQENELSPPNLVVDADSFSITLNHKPIYSQKDILFLDQFSDFDPDKEMKTVILLGQSDTEFSMQNIWDAVGIVDTEHYRQLIDKLIKLGILNNYIDREKAKRLARKQGTPFREFKRFKITIPQDRPSDRNSAYPNIQGDQERKVFGTIKWFDNVKKYGFISVKDSSDIFVHSTKIVSESSLVEGQMVSFDIDSSGERPQAINVEILDA
ncbi:ATP-binding protein [Shewanella chilikensis]|uniref:ATP-binding protein n=1 Tax=Shewanella chilikensis TaxID=558541 RepID=UPI00399A96E5